MEKLIAKVIDLITTVKLEEYYNYEFNSASFSFNSFEKNTLNLMQTNFDKNVLLKLILNKLLKDKGLDIVLVSWIINQWGGINSFQLQSSPDSKVSGLGKNSLKIQSFIKNLEESNKVATLDFNTIASLSKVASFKNINEYVIYDSRVIYSLNWLLLKYAFGEHKFFPMPPSRNSTLNKFDLNTIIKLYLKSRVDDSDNLSKYYIEKAIAYQHLCVLVKQINSIIWQDKKWICGSQTLLWRDYPFFLEMFLFSIAENLIYEDISQSVSLTIIQQ